MLNKRLVALVLFFCTHQFLFVSQVYAQVKSQVVIINQVRGHECCEKGSLEAFRFQLDALHARKLPATFMLRYDALLDSQYTSSFLHYPEFHKGLFLEITPQLARAAGVAYEGDESSWYVAKHAFLLGYSVEDRKKIIDTAMQAFYAAFHFYPNMTAAWMIDAWSLQYLSEHYHVLSHEITRDQWGTDSYTLYGGPMGITYQPSRHWPLIPASGDSALRVNIFRQTIPDPLLNYGDTSSATTSQPNDYALAQKDIQYFKDLLEQTVTQQTTAHTAVLGLENSMNMHFQEEFENQLNILLELQETYSNAFDIQDVSSTVPNNTQKIAVLHGKDVWHSSQADVPESWWITTLKYRARVIHTKSTFALTDLRVYGDQLSDPYISSPLKTNQAYWIAPFVLDGSRFRSVEEKNLRKISILRQLLSGIWKIPKTTSDPSQVFSDIYAQPIAMKFAQPLGSVQEILQDEKVILQYQTEHGNARITFTQEEIVSEGSKKPEWNVPLDKIPQNTGAELHISSRDGDVVLTPSLSMREQDNRWYFPEENTHPIDIQHSSLYVYNLFARVKRNPIRLVIILRDSFGMPTKPLKKPELLCNKSLCKNISWHRNDSQGMYYVDVIPDRSEVVRFDIQIDDQAYHIGYAWLTEDCRHEWKKCAVHPLSFVGYVFTSMFDRLQLGE